MLSFNINKQKKTVVNIWQPEVNTRKAGVKCSIAETHEKHI